ncbi:MAG: HAMP domain-containing sensor histidine kinase, partial [Brachymonas sp.]|nr:HAMP domain-containing sensor histidine kinase [Brachymonas sp.]
VSPLVHSVNEMMERQKDLLETQKHFLANAAHQLKTPLAGLRMQADLALRGDADTEELKRSLQQIGLSSIRATHTVNQLLALARAESSALVRQPCNMAHLVQEVVKDCLPHALEKRIDLGYEGAEPDAAGVWVQGNTILLYEMVRNLVDNALHYTPSQRDDGEPGMVTARVMSDPFGQVLVVQVEDNGPGIPAAEREQVFKPFYRTLGNAADGSGLGLPIVLEIARQHGATVTLDDAPLRQGCTGALFSIRFASVHPAGA